MWTPSRPSVWEAATPPQANSVHLAEPFGFGWLRSDGEDSTRGFGAVKINDLPFCIYWSKFSEDYRVGKQAFVCNSYKLSLE